MDVLLLWLQALQQSSQVQFVVAPRCPSWVCCLPGIFKTCHCPDCFGGACQNFSSRTEELYVLNLNLLLPNFERDCILVVMGNDKYLLTGNYVSLIVCNGGKLHGEVLVWSWKQSNKFFNCFSLMTRRIPDLLEMLYLTSLKYMEMLKYTFTK